MAMPTMLIRKPMKPTMSTWSGFLMGSGSRIRWMDWVLGEIKLFLNPFSRINLNENGKAKGQQEHAVHQRAQHFGSNPAERVLGTFAALRDLEQYLKCFIISNLR
jgi:hypothetical protein